ncbi:MAG: iron-containing alcohol dehydrogenase, partial [Richelia sp. SM2_1_7]|nr:iron-containing alcohol dehydrogenase [Richelia sp. SM2_1_7]
VETGARLARDERVELVASIGGGSAMDLGKAIAAMATNEGAITDYLEVIGRGQPLLRAPLPFIAIPTTAGTGTEVTRNAVLSSREHRVKVSLRSPMMLAHEFVAAEALLKEQGEWDKIFPETQRQKAANMLKLIIIAVYFAQI